MGKKFIVIFIMLPVVFIIIQSIYYTFNKSENDNENKVDTTKKLSNMYEEDKEYKIVLDSGASTIIYKKMINDWRLVLVNYDNILPTDFNVELANIDKTRKFDARAVDDLNKLIKDMKGQGISNIWPQSTYRSIAKQEELFNESIQKYINHGLTQEEAENLTMNFINKPGASEHNLGLAVDFNNVEKSFEDTKEFKWLQENAENYGFVLRYPEDKEEITKVNYEPWHWRYVGVEHAKKMNELNMCLEEYINYLSTEIYKK